MFRKTGIHWIDTTLINSFRNARRDVDGLNACASQDMWRMMIMPVLERKPVPVGWRIVNQFLNKYKGLAKEKSLNSETFDCASPYEVKKQCSSMCEPTCWNREPVRNCISFLSFIMSHSSGLRQEMWSSKVSMQGRLRERGRVLSIWATMPSCRPCSSAWCSVHDS